MNEDKPEGVNPHTGQSWPADPANPSAPGAPAADMPPAAKPAGPPQWSSTPSQQELAVRAALETVMDPEIQLSVIDLGLIREVHFLPGKTLVRMMLTTPFCPYAPQMIEDVKGATESAVQQPCEVDMLPDPWSPDMMPDPGLLGFSF
jgi:metal-sulfur cluster biosynthetic enzyme